MADKRIFNLTEATTAGDNDLLALDNSNFPETKKIKVSKLKAADAQKLDITSLYNLTGTTNTTGSTIHKGTFFYLNGSLSVALADIAPGATFTFDTNYVATTVGDELTDVKQTLSTIDTTLNSKATVKGSGSWYHTADVSCSAASGGLAYLFTEIGIIRLGTSSSTLYLQPISIVGGNYLKLEGSGLEKTITVWANESYTSSKNTIWRMIPFNGTWTITLS